MFARSEFDMSDKMYICIDLKSFFASVECVERGLDPLKASLVVADPSRSEKTICLAVSPALRKLGVKNRCRLFEIPDSLDYIIAPPRMQKYIDYSAEIYGIYLKYISKDDIHPYSIDEAFIDVTPYLSLYGMTARELGIRIMDDIYKTLGIRATCGIGTNMYLTKVALDITAKYNKDFIGELDEAAYRRQLWDHRPLTDFWRFGPGTEKKLAKYGIYTMRDIANTDEDFLYKLFGIDAELIIDHAYGREPVTIADIKSYHAKSNSISNGQVLPRDYEFDEGLLIVKEMMDLMCLDLVDKGVVTKSVTLHVGYSNRYQRNPAHKSFSLTTQTNSDIVLIPAIEKLYREIIDPFCPIRRVTISCNNIVPEEFTQYSFFLNTEAMEKNRQVQRAVIDIKNKFGKNAILKGMNLEAGATTRERNNQIGGHSRGEQTEN